MKKLGLALGSGGSRGIAHIGFLQALEEAVIRPYCISGCSMG
ncbi:MAG: patatin-like phospholipase family protein [Clostridia bacterium]|nr:patatin-like phospholipase family protein [Clostridia bacterium]